jgi:hypothetical protein
MIENMRASIKRREPQWTDWRVIGAVVLLVAGLGLCLLFPPLGVELCAVAIVGVAAVVVLLRPHWMLYLLVVGLPLHNLLMSLLFHATGNYSFVKRMQTWKDVLLLLALLRMYGPVVLGWWRTRRIRLAPLDVVVGLFVALAGVSLVLVGHGVPLGLRVLGFREWVYPFAAYALGRRLEVDGRWFSRGRRGHEIGGAVHATRNVNR